MQEELSHLFDPEKSEYVPDANHTVQRNKLQTYSKAILINGAQIVPSNEGDKRWLGIADQDAMIAATLSQLAANDAAEETTAIITKTLADAEAAYAALRDQADVTIIRTENQRLVPGTITVPAYLAKGLEFDAVIMWDASEGVYHGDDERQLVYTIASRAMHQLTVLAINKLTSLLANVDSQLYEMG